MTDRRLIGAWTASLAVASTAVTLHPIHESDPFWHMTLGRAVLAARSRTVVEPSSYLAEGTPRVVPEWLWDVLTYLLYQLGGWPLLQVLVAAMAAGCAVVVVALLSRRSSGSMGALVLVSALVMAVVSLRFRIRPQAAFLLLLPLVLLMTDAYGRASGRRRWGLVGGVVLVQLLWAQLHGSHVIGVATFTVSVFVLMWRPVERRIWWTHVVALVLVAATLVTSAHGFQTS